MGFPNQILVELEFKKRKKEKERQLCNRQKYLAIDCDKFVLFSIKNCVNKFEGLYSCGLIGGDFFDGFGL